MGLKFNNGHGAGTCDKCGTMLWSGFRPNHYNITPYNYYKNKEMFCKECDPYLKDGISKEVIERSDRSKY